MSKEVTRRCKIFNCDRRHGHYCCSHCEHKDGCKNRCLNSPERCRQSRPETMKEAAARTGVRIVSRTFVKRLLASDQQGEHYEPIGKYIARADGMFVGIDNSTGNAWTEEFRTADECIAWLLGYGPPEDYIQPSAGAEPEKNT